MELDKIKAIKEQLQDIVDVLEDSIPKHRNKSIYKTKPATTTTDEEKGTSWFTVLLHVLIIVLFVVALFLGKEVIENQHLLKEGKMEDHLREKVTHLSKAADIMFWECRGFIIQHFGLFLPESVRTFDNSGQSGEPPHGD